MIPTTRGPSPRVTHSSADREFLIQSILEAVQARRTIIPQRSQERELEFMLWDTLPVVSITEEKTSAPVLHPVGGSDPIVERSVETWAVFLLRITGACFPFSTAGMVCGRAEWSIPGFTDMRRWT